LANPYVELVNLGIGLGCHCGLRLAKCPNIDPILFQTPDCSTLLYVVKLTLRSQWANFRNVATISESDKRIPNFY
jgi:hypothetical protein